MIIPCICPTNTTTPQDSLEHFQGKLKTIKKDNLQKLKTSILQQGWAAPIFTWQNKILDGHHRLQALKSLQEEGHQLQTHPNIPTIEIQAQNKKQAAQLILAYNSQYASITRTGLEQFITDFQLDLEELSHQIKIEVKSELSEIPEVQLDPNQEIKVQVKTGQVWQLDQHRIMCADCTNKQNVQKLTNNQPIHLIFSSPPYNLAISDIYLGYQDNLSDPEYFSLNTQSISAVLPQLQGFVMWNMSYGKNARWQHLQVILNFVKEQGLEIIDHIIWNKKTAMPVITDKQLVRTYEKIFVLATKELAQNNILTLYTNQGQYSLNKINNAIFTNYWEIQPNGTQHKYHKATFPIQIPQKGILLTTLKHQNVYDPFGGTGTTLLASEALQRNCYLMEIEPLYCQITINRWEMMTGKKAKLVTDNDEQTPSI